MARHLSLDSSVWDTLSPRGCALHLEEHEEAKRAQFLEVGQENKAWAMYCCLGNPPFVLKTLHFKNQS